MPRRRAKREGEFAVASRQVEDARLRTGQQRLQRVEEAHVAAERPVQPVEGAHRGDPPVLLEVRVVDVLPAPGSPWWRGVNERLLVDAELAAAAHEAGAPAAAVPSRARPWLAYVAAPSAASWFRAHNASVLHGYVAHVDAARAETASGDRPG